MAPPAFAQPQPSFPCRAPEEPLRRLICANEDLAASEFGVAQRLKALEGELTPQSYRSVADTQPEWERFIKAMCIADPASPEGQAAATVCLIERYSERLLDLDVPAATAGDLRLEGRMRFRADFEARLHEEDVYPHLASPRSAALAFNAHAAKELRLDRPLIAGDASPSADWSAYHRRGFEIAYAGSQFLSLPIYEDWLLGDSDGGRSQRTINWNVEKNRPLRFEDLFQAGADWRPTVIAAARVALQEQLELDTGSAEPTPDAVGRVVARIENWTFRPGRAVIHFGAGTVASQSAGEFDVELAYEEVARYRSGTIQLPGRESSPDAPR